MKRPLVRPLYAAALISILALAGCNSAPKETAQTETPQASGTAPATTDGNPGSMAAAYQVTDLDGKTVTHADFAGKVVILDFWATWCPPCKAEIPHFNTLQAKYGSQGLNIVGMSLDTGGAKEVREFMQKTKIDYTMLIASDEVAKAYGGINSIPTTFVIDRQGKIVKRFIGFTSPEVFEETIAPLLAVAS